MASYTNPEDVRRVLAKDLSDADGTAATIADERVTEAIKAAETKIDSRLAGRYKVPFTAPVPSAVQYMCRDIAAYETELVYRESKDFSSELDPVYLRYRQAMEFLQQLADGDAHLVGLEDGSGAAAQARGVSRSPGRFFTLGDFGLGTRPGRGSRRVVTRHEQPPF